MFSIGIAVPIPNHKFDQPTYVSATLTSAVTANSLIIYLTAVSPTASEVRLYTLLKRDDTLTLTSSNTSYSGYTEQVEIEKVEAYSTTGAKLTLKSPISYAYNSGDAVKGYGSGFPEGWILGSSMIDSLKQTTIIPPGGGYSDDYSFYALCDVAGLSWAALRDFDLPYFNEYCWYRQGTMVRAYLTGSNTQLVLSAFTSQGYGSAPTYVFRKYFKPTADNTWEQVTNTFISSPNLSYYVDGSQYRTDRYGNIALEFNVDSTLYSYAWAAFDDVFLEHIRGIAPLSQSMMNIAVSTPSYPVSVMVSNPTDFTVGSTVSVWGQSNTTTGTILFAQGKIDAISGTRLTISGLPAGYHWASGAMIEEKNDGYYTFEEYPDQEVSWESVSNVSMNRTTNNGLKVTNPSGWGERTTKVQVTMKFTNVSYSFYRKLKKFEDACKRGELINLHQDVTSQDLPELKQPFIQGILQLSGFTHSIWDRQKVSFQLQVFES